AISSLPLRCKYGAPAAQITINGPSITQTDHSTMKSSSSTSPLGSSNSGTGNGSSGGPFRSKSTLLIIMTSVVTALTVLLVERFAFMAAPYPPPHPHALAHGSSHRSSANGGASSFQNSQSSTLSPSILKYLAAQQALSFIPRIQFHERHVYSQLFEDGIIEYIFDNIGVTDKFYVEFGTETCAECTTRHLWDMYGWNGVLMDGTGKTGDSRVIYNHFMTAENIVGLLKQHDVPQVFDFLCLDIDLNEYHIARAVLEGGFRPNVLILEVNRNFGPTDSFAIKYNPKTYWQGGPKFGQSPLAATRLATKHGYLPLYYDNNGVNMFFIHTDRMKMFLNEKTGFEFSDEEVSLLMPSFESIYRRQDSLFANDLKSFWKEFDEEEWVVVGVDGMPE
ncbi:hypothetical protein HDU76_005980, partial [Blyttiomyces sp. JEL0837]